jgi:hypothetical protein
VVTAVAAAGALLAGCEADGPADRARSTLAAADADDPGDDAAAAYCEESGGSVETRHPYWGTNNDQSQWIQLAGEIELCMFADRDDHRIYVDTTTLAADVPSLAAAAYLAKLPTDDVGVSGNPSVIACDDVVEGTANWGTTVAGGGWVNLDDPVFTVVDLCVFPDMSAIDAWGITYYSGGVVRGQDLAELFRFDPGVAAGIFPY